MKQAEQLTLDLSNRTPWMKGPPPFIGWWETRPASSTGPRQLDGTRRWFSGEMWSSPVLVGDDHDFVPLMLHFCVHMDEIEYRGLTAPADHYPYALDPHHAAALEDNTKPRIQLEEPEEEERFPIRRVTYAQTLADEIHEDHLMRRFTDTV